MINSSASTQQHSEQNRIKIVSEYTFRRLIKDGRIRGASLNDIHGTHHTRNLYEHPRTKQLYVEMPPK